jgi:hypothetical protein
MMNTGQKTTASIVSFPFGQADIPRRLVWSDDAFIRTFAFAIHSNQLVGILSRNLSDLLFFPLHQCDGQSLQWGRCYFLFIKEDGNCAHRQLSSYQGSSPCLPSPVLPRFRKNGSHCLNSTATRHIFADVPLWLHRLTHQGVLTRRPYSSSLAGQAAF